MSEINWTSFRRKINIAATKDQILNAWLTQDKIEKWFLSNAQFFDGDKIIDKNARIAKGNTYKWSWHTSDVLAEGEVLEVGDNGLTFTFVGCPVKVSVSKEDGENILELTQSEIGTDEETKMGTYLECTRGWTFYMTNLKSVLEGGLDLRNRNDNIKNMLNT